MARETHGRSIRDRWRIRSLFIFAALTGACGSRTVLDEASSGTVGADCVGAACATHAEVVGHVWTASSVAVHLQVFNQPGIDGASSICGPAVRSFFYTLATQALTDRSCYVTAVGAGTVAVDAATADAIVAQLEGMRLADRSMCTADTPTYAIEVSQDPGPNRTFQDCAPRALEVPPFIAIDDLDRLDRLLTDAVQRARDAGR